MPRISSDTKVFANRDLKVFSAEFKPFLKEMFLREKQNILKCDDVLNENFKYRYELEQQERDFLINCYSGKDDIQSALKWAIARYMRELGFIQVNKIENTKYIESKKNTLVLHLEQLKDLNI